MHREKGVLVAVYVETARRKKWLSNTSHQLQHHHPYLHLHEAENACNGRGYNRKAQLLAYTRQLRESARSQASSPLINPKPVSHDDCRQPMTQMISLKSKRRHGITPTCLGNWKLLPASLRSLLMPHKRKQKKYTNKPSTATKIKALMKSFQVKRKGGFTSKLFATLRNRR